VNKSDFITYSAFRWWFYLWYPSKFTVLLYSLNTFHSRQQVSKEEWLKQQQQQITHELRTSHICQKVRLQHCKCAVLVAFKLYLLLSQQQGLKLKHLARTRSLCRLRFHWKDQVLFRILLLLTESPGSSPFTNFCDLQIMRFASAMNLDNGEYTQFQSFPCQYDYTHSQNFVLKRRSPNSVLVSM
jgi:hypothetical protein